MILLLLCWLPVWADTTLPAPVAQPASVVQAATDQGRGTPFKLDKADNLCGVSEARQLTVPAKVDYSTLLKATSEYKELVRKKLDPKSAKGIALMTRAKTRVVDACELVRSGGSFCSVWKKISRRDGGSIPDLTQQVLKGL